MSDITGQYRAKLRICASCRWIFKLNNKVHPETGGCPKCGFGHYGAYWAMGRKVDRYQYSQEPSKQAKVSSYIGSLDREIEETNSIKDPDKRAFKLVMHPDY